MTQDEYAELKGIVLAIFTAGNDAIILFRELQEFFKRIPPTENLVVTQQIEKVIGMFHETESAHQAYLNKLDSLDSEIMRILHYL